MDRYKRIKAYVVKRKGIFVGLAACIAVCIIFVAAFVLNISRASALESVSVADTTYEIQKDNLEIELKVANNGKYVIDGGGVKKNEVYIKISPATENVDNVEIVLKNAKIHNSQDKPTIEFSAAKADSATNYTLSVEGECYLENVREGVKSPVISVQSISVSVIKLSEDVHTARNCKLSDLLQETDVVYSASLNIKNSDGEKGVLTIVNSLNSYGAAIGGGEVNSDADIELNEGNTSIMFSPNYLLKEDGTPYDTMQNAFEYLNEKYNTDYELDTELPVGKEFFVSSFTNGGDISISGDIELNIKGQGYGAGIGGGGSASESAVSGKAGVVNINGGTVAVNMSSDAPCIGSGINSMGGKNNKGNSIIISGGSLFMNAAKVQYNGNITDRSGKKLYLFCLDLTDEGNKGFSQEDWNGEIILSDSRYTNKYTAKVQMHSSYASINIDGVSYKYNGYGHNNISGIGINKSEAADKLYFYLPATPKAELDIDGDSFLKQSQRIEVYQNDTPVSADNKNKYILSANQYVDVRVYDVPDELSVSNVTVGGMTYPVTKLNDEKGDYYIVSFKMPETATLLKVNYIGYVQIVYRDGFAAADDVNHDYKAPLSTVYTYGTAMALPNMNVSDLIFDGWYVTGTDRRVSMITSADILEGDILKEGRIDLTAKWKCKVTYTYSYGNSGDIELRTDEYTYGAAYTFDAASDALPIPPDIEYYEFAGWNVNSEIYSKENGKLFYVNSLLTSIEVKGEYSRNRFYVYIDKSFFDTADVDVIMGSRTLSFDAEEFVENGIAYYRTLADEAVKDVTVNIVAKYGYELSGDRWNVQIENAVTVAAGTMVDNSISYKLGLNEKDIYIKNIDCQLIPKVYTITFLDGIDSENPFKTVEYTVESMELPADIADIVGDDAAKINGRYDRYHKFTGWKSIVEQEASDPYVTRVETLGNHIFVAVWEEMEKYPIDITVYDEETKAPSEYIGAVLYLYDTVSGERTPISITKVTDYDTGEIKDVIYVIPGDNVYIDFVALDENGNYIYENGDYKTIDIGRGISFADIAEYPDDYTIRYSYESKAQEATTKKNHSDKRYITIPDDVKNGAPISVDVRIAVTKFTIKYWDLRGYTTNNPDTYTVFDEFELAPLLENVGWELVVSDNDDTNYDDVTTTDIIKVSRWSWGNLILKADWSEKFVGFYNINILSDDLQKGEVKIVAPSKEGYKEGQSVFLTVTPKEGYRLVKNSLVYMSSDKSGLNTIKSISVSALPVVITPVDEKTGLYLLMMPGRDIEITAGFELETYNIFYDEMKDSDVNKNPSTYTINDKIILNNPERKGYEFVGWRNEAGNIVKEIKNQTGDIKLTAWWRENKQEVITDNDNTVSNEQETTVKNQFIGGNGNNINGGHSWNNGNEVRTGDSTNIVRLTVILVLAAVVLVLIVIKTKKNDEEEKED